MNTKVAEMRRPNKKKIHKDKKYKMVTKFKVWRKIENKYISETLRRILINVTQQLIEITEWNPAT